jgi:hypothetical protein
MPVPRWLVLIAALWATGCASVTVHGVVRDEQGQPVPNAVAKVSDETTGAVVVTGSANENGCLDLFELVKGKSQSFVLRVEAPGYREAVLSFSRKEVLTLAVTLMPESGPAESALRRLPWDEPPTTYRIPCVQAVPPGAGMIGVR